MDADRDSRTTMAPSHAWAAGRAAVWRTLPNQLGPL